LAHALKINIFNIHTNIKQNKRLLTQKLWEELAGQMTYPICKIHYQIKGQNSSKRGQNGMKFYHSLEILTNKLQNIFQLDMWKENEIISRKPRTDIQTSPYHNTSRLKTGV
jgi:hypothetical protein